MAQKVPEAFGRDNHIIHDRVIRRPEVERRVGLSRSSIYRRIAEGTFCKPVPLGGGKAVGWLESEVDAWLDACVARRDNEGTEATATAPFNRQI